MQQCLNWIQMILMPQIRLSICKVYSKKPALFSRADPLIFKQSAKVAVPFAFI